ncbi:MAG: GNAT family N-acetyltransferase [Candidatus Hodarchaeota archaeon]
MWYQISKFIMRQKHRSDPQVFIKHLQRQPLSIICYILWYHHKQQEQTQLTFRLNPFRFIHRFENKYTLYGKNVWKLKRKIRWFETNLVLMFNHEEIWSDLNKRFTNFRSLETNQPTDFFNVYITLSLSKDSFIAFNNIDKRIIELPTQKYSIPKRYRPISSGLNYGLIKDGEVVSFAAAPHILIQNTFSFAILRGIETKLLERRQGYALQTVGVLCNELFSRYKLTNIFLWVEDTNKAALDLYEKLGFKKEAVIFATYCDQK